MTREEKLQEIEKQWNKIQSIKLPIEKPPKKLIKGG